MVNEEKCTGSIACVLRKSINVSLIKLYAKEYELICTTRNKTETHNSEMGIVNHFSSYLRNELARNRIFEGYNVDCEYNRNMEYVKDLPSFPQGTRPDLIIHDRGFNKANLLVVEFKGWWNMTHKEVESDKQKIREFMDKRGKYKYGFGLFIMLGREKAIVEELRMIKDRFQWIAWDSDRGNED